MSQVHFINRKPELLKIAKIKATINSIKINLKEDLPLKSVVKKVYLNFPLNKPCITSSKAAITKQSNIFSPTNFSKTKNLLQTQKNLVVSPIKADCLNRKKSPCVFFLVDYFQSRLFDEYFI